MDKDLQKIHDKINKLIRLEEGAREIGSMEEAANAAAQIQKLLLKYNLDRNSIEPEKVKERIISKEITIDKRHGYKKTESDWMLILANIVSVHNMTKLVVTNKHSMAQEGIIRLTIFGEAETIDQVEYLTLQLILRIKGMRNQAFKDRLKTHPTEKKNAYYRSYCRACAAAIGMKFREMEEEVTREYKGGSELMVINKEALDIKANEVFPRLKTSSTGNKRLKSSAGYHDGNRNGSNMNIHKGLN